MLASMIRFQVAQGMSVANVAKGFDLSYQHVYNTIRNAPRGNLAAMVRAMGENKVAIAQIAHTMGISYQHAYNTINK